MRILIDGYWWAEGPISNRMVLLEIVRQWIDDYPDDELLIATPSVADLDCFADRGRHVRFVRTHLRTHPAINVIELPMLRRLKHADSILSFNFASPSKRSIVFLHDVMFQSNPEWFTKAERAYFAGMPLLAPGARAVITTSQTERERITRCNPRLKRVVACGLSVSQSLLRAPPLEPDLPLRPNSFLLAVSRLNVRKNLAPTMRAVLQSGFLSRSCPLVVVGESSGRFEGLAGFHDAIAAGLVLVTGSVTEAEMNWLYRNCRLFICLSLDEGFGLPPVESAILGSPVLVSDIAVFKETLGDYATFVSPHDEVAIAGEIRRLLTGEQPQRHYVPGATWHTVCKVIRTELVRAIGNAD